MLAFWQGGNDVHTEPQNFSAEDAKRLAATPAANRLFALLKQTDGQGLQKAMEDAAKGNYSNAMEKLKPLLASQEVQNLIRQLGGK